MYIYIYVFMHGRQNTSITENTRHVHQHGWCRNDKKSKTQGLRTYGTQKVYNLPNS